MFPPQSVHRVEGFGINPLTKLERWTILMTAVWFGDFVFPGPTSLDFVAGVLTAFWTYVGLAGLVFWIKSGGDSHL